MGRRGRCLLAQIMASETGACRRLLDAVGSPAVGGNVGADEAEERPSGGLAARVQPWIWEGIFAKRKEFA